MTQRKAHYCFTLNNPACLPDLNHPDIKYAVYQEEIGENGTNHLQGYIEFAYAKTIKGIKKQFKDLAAAHLEPRRGSQVQARDYAMKQDETYIAGPYEFGTFTPQGTRTDLAVLFAKIKEGTPVADLADEYPTKWAVYRNSLSAYAELCLPPVTASYPLADFTHPPLDLSKPVLLVGPSGCGKTQFALAHFKNPLLVTHIDDLKKFTSKNDGIVFDDISFRHWPAESIIQLLQWDTPASIHCRYSNAHMPARTPRIYTHNDADIFYPEKITSRDQEAAINRRFRRVILDGSLFSNDNNQ